ncbi:Hypothetical protein YwpE [Listeria floridensis FSL S10-1187]|uniref:Sortase n=1 Tax=Listeria floridensis FSL S10-1187 TaxID=1265817 RepID=A0ABN0RIB7_9LIST|nr:sortase [Listeria floridensis]EUJ33697.1 Hypothetical protein YwpE [Listeria floridensis FSL S10-1187]
MAQQDGTNEKVGYKVTTKQIVSYKRGDLMDESSDAHLTLITCDEAVKTDKRIVVKAVPVTS